MQHPDILSGQARITNALGTSAGGINSLILANAFNTSANPDEAALVAESSLKGFWQDVSNTGWGLSTLVATQKTAKMTTNMFPHLRSILGGDAVAYPNIPPLMFAGLDASVRSLPRGTLSELIIKNLQKHIGKDIQTTVNGPLKTHLHYCDGDFETYLKQETQTWKNKIVTGQDTDWDSVKKSVALLCSNGYADDEGRIGFDGAYLQNGLATPLVDMGDINTVIYIGLHGTPQKPREIEPVDSIERHLPTDKNLAKSILSAQFNFNWVVNQIDEERKPQVINVTLQPEKSWNETSRMNTHPLLIADLTKRGDKDMREAMGLEESHVGGMRLAFAS